MIGLEGGGDLVGLDGLIVYGGGGAVGLREQELEVIAAGVEANGFFEIGDGGVALVLFVGVAGVGIELERFEGRLGGTGRGLGVGQFGARFDVVEAQIG